MEKNGVEVLPKNVVAAQHSVFSRLVVQVGNSNTVDVHEQPLKSSSRSSQGSPENIETSPHRLSSAVSTGSSSEVSTGSSSEGLNRSSFSPHGIDSVENVLQENSPLTPSTG